LLGVLLAAHVLPRALNQDPRRPVFALADIYWTLAVAALCLAVVVIARALRARAGAGHA
jgi:hypothetical protein